MRLSEISIVIPCYNEEKRIGRTLQKIYSYAVKNFSKYEILVVDDGSRDNTATAIKNFQKRHPNTILLSSRKNCGKGSAIRIGALSAKYQFLLYSDADLSTPIEELNKFKKYLNYDIVFGSRSIKGAVIKIKQPVYRTFLGRAFPILVKLLVLRGFYDTQCGFKLFNIKKVKKIFRKQLLNRFAFDVELLYLAKKFHFTVKEVPVVWTNANKSKVRLFKDTFNMLFDLLKIRINNLLGKYD